MNRPIVWCLPLCCMVAIAVWYAIPPSPISAAQRGDLEGLKRALQSGRDVNMVYVPFGPDARPGWTPLMFAMAKADVEAVRFLIENGADPSYATKEGVTPLRAAVWYGQSQEDRTCACIEIVARAGGDVNAQDCTGLSPLHIAVGQRKCQVVAKFLECGGDVKRKAGDGTSLLAHARCYGENDCVIKLLVAHGAD
ncbi:MAG: ankyrin repeat domain-containing protein [Planctomycetes bacterium]|nr:ankyrin repeat domain-containing protein [Planctomycetota bacterium]